MQMPTAIRANNGLYLGAILSMDTNDNLAAFRLQVHYEMFSTATEAIAHAQWGIENCDSGELDGWTCNPARAPEE